MGVVVLCAVYFFAIDHILKTIIETQGSKALTAKLDVGAVAFHILPTSIRLEGVQVTNPQQPQRNLIEMRTLFAPLSFAAIEQRKIDIPTMEIGGLRFNTTRAQSGALNASADLASSGTENGTKLPDAAQLAAQQQQSMQSELQKTKADLTAILFKWQQRLQQLPDDQRIESYRQRAANLQSTHNSAGLTALRQELTTELSGARKLLEELELELQQVRAQFGYAQALPRNGANIGGTPKAINAMAGALLGEQFKPLLLSIAQQIGRLIDTAQNDVGAQNWPLLIRSLTLDGQLDLGAQPLLFTGTLDNFTPQPKFWNVATHFELAGAAQPNRFSARGDIDLRKTPRLDARFDLREFPLQQFPLSKNPQFTIVIEQAQTDIQGMLSLIGNQIDINLLSRFQRAALTVQTGNDSSSQALANALRDVGDFDLNVQVSGAVQNPTMKLDSSLSQRLASVMNQLPAQSGAGSSTELPVQLPIQLQQPMNELAQLRNDFENLQRQFTAKQAALQSLVDL
jgi:hypothetical protein